MQMLVINILLSLNVAYILKTCVLISALLQAANILILFVMHQYVGAHNQFDNSVSTLKKIVLQC
jgi:hypothetical protein